jgi:glutathione S-transferase
MPTLRLSYFDSAGRAEPIRNALRISGIPFEDRRLKFPEFVELRASGAFPLGSVPVLEVDGLRIAQTAAILRYVARIGDTTLYPTDPLAALRVDSALDSLNDTLSGAMLPSLFERDPAKKLAMRAELAAGPMARVFGYIESLLEQSGGPFVGGQTMSIADLVLAAQVLQIRSGILDGLSAENLAPYPRLSAVADAYLADPRVVALGKK